MKKVWFATLLTVLFGTGALAADKNLRAITEDGRKVILRTDGQWIFDTTQDKAIPRASNVYQTNVPGFSLTYDNTKWKPQPSDTKGMQVFRHTTYPLFSMAISDEMPATVEAMKSVALYHAKKADPNAKIITEEMRKIGEKDILTLKFMAKIENLPFFYYGNYYANQSGNVQVVCYTSQQLFHKYENECQQFIDGLKIR